MEEVRGINKTNQPFTRPRDAGLCPSIFGSEGINNQCIENIGRYLIHSLVFFATPFNICLVVGALFTVCMLNYTVCVAGGKLSKSTSPPTSKRESECESESDMSFV